MRIVLILGFLFSVGFTQANERPFVLVNSTENVQKQEDNFQRIDVSQLPKAIVDAVQRDYSGATIAEAYVNELSIYKLVLVSGPDKKTFYADAQGNWIDEP
jgi:hypothetical protein